MNVYGYTKRLPVDLYQDTPARDAVLIHCFEDIAARIPARFSDLKFRVRYTFWQVLLRPTWDGEVTFPCDSAEDPQCNTVIMFIECDIPQLAIPFPETG